MRAPLLFLALAAFAAACGSGSSPPRSGPSTPREVRVYQSSLPRCPVREVGSVRGRTLRDIRRAAMQLRAHAVLLDRRNPDSTEPHEGSAVVFLREGCYR